MEEVGLDASESGDDATAGILRVDDAHHGGLAYDHGLRPRHVADQLLGQRMGAQAADLLVVAEGEVHRHLQFGLLEGGDVGKASRDETLHVAGAAAIEVAVGLFGQRPGDRSSRAARRSARRRCGLKARCRPSAAGPMVAKRLALVPSSFGTSVLGTSWSVR